MAPEMGQPLFHFPSTFQTSKLPRSTHLPASSTYAIQPQSVIPPPTTEEPFAILDITRHGSPPGRGVLIGLLSALGSALVFMLILSLVYFLRYTSKGRILLDRIGRPGEFDDEQAFAREEADALEEMDDIQRAEYMRAKVFVESNPPESAQTDISLSQFLGIQEKGVSAWEFEPALEIANCFVEGRTEIEFFDTECSVQTNLPVPKQNEVYYWEAKIYDKPDASTIGIGMTTKPYPLFKMPGYHRTSLSYLSPGHRRFNQPFPSLPAANTTYGPPYVRGDVVGVGYRPRSGTIFFTRNGKKLDDVTHTLKTQNLFPTVGANGPCTVHVNFGQMGFVYIEANVKKWGLAPMTGSLAPPPPYGSEQGSILLDQGQRGISEGQADAWASTQGGRHARSRSAQVRLARAQLTRSPGPQRSPTDISLSHFEYMDEDGDVDESIVGSSDIVGEGSSLVNGQGYETIIPTEESRGEGLGLGTDMLGVDQPPPEYSSPLERSPDLGYGRRRGGKAKRRRQDYFDAPSDEEGSADGADRRYRDYPSDEDGASGENDDDHSPQTDTHQQRRQPNVPPADRSPPVPYDVAVGSGPPRPVDDLDGNEQADR